MPRQRKVVMERIDPEQMRASAVKAALDKNEPYRIFSAKQRGEPKGEGYSIIHVDPTGKRELVMGCIEDRDTAKDFVRLLEQAWVQGRRSVMMD